MRIDIILKRLEEEQVNLAKGALQQPQGRDAFEYGRSVGMYSGIEHAITVIMEMVAEREKKDWDL